MNKSLGIYNIIDKQGINKSILNVINKNIDFNTYTTPKGLKELRQEICRLLLNLWNYKVSYQDMIITTGSQQSINLIINTLLQDNDTVLIEEPTYFGAIDAFKKRKLKLIGITFDEEGINLKDLENKIVKYSPKIIYVTPTFNNPTGYSWTQHNRKKFLSIINKYNVLVIEDDPYSLINYTTNTYDSLSKLNDGKNIIYISTFSKIISPSVNVGYIIANKKIIDSLYSYKKSFDLSTSALLQYIVLDYLQNNDIRKIMHKKIQVYKEKLSESIKEIKTKYHKKIKFISKPKGGLFYLVELMDEIDKEIFEDANMYYLENTNKNITRINICS